MLRHLPGKDEWPPLIKTMFGITGPTAREGAYDHDLIHFGATLKGLDPDEAAAWIAKFESLLTRLFWFRATMHIDWIFGNRLFHWQADSEQVRRFVWDGVAATPNRWTFDDRGEPLKGS